MILILVWLIAVVLGTTAAIHLYWALGGIWPLPDQQALARTVIGITGIRHMPPKWLIAIVMLGIALAAVWPMLWAGWIAVPLPHWLATGGMMLLCLVFLGRGIAGYIPETRRRFSEEPFATLNARYFSPIIILLGAAFAYLLLAHSW